jgi:hypothetical protein
MLERRGNDVEMFPAEFAAEVAQEITNAFIEGFLKHTLTAIPKTRAASMSGITALTRFTSIQQLLPRSEAPFSRNFVCDHGGIEPLATDNA